MLTATQLKNNTCFLYQGEPYKVLQYKHTHLSRRGADIKVKAKNLKTGSILTLNLGSNERFQEVKIEKKKMQFLYLEEELFYFMDPEIFEQVEISSKLIGNLGKFLKEGQLINVLFYQDEAIDLDMPASVVIEVAECDPGVKGNSATNIFKSALTKNGLKIKVPLFIKKGDGVKVDTRSGEYVGRVS